MSFVSDVSRSDVSVNVGRTRGFHFAIRTLIAMSLATKVPQVSGYGGLLGETTSTVETFESFTLVRMIFIPIQEAFHLRRIVNKVHAVPFEKLLPLIVTWKHQDTRWLIHVKATEP